MSEKSKRQLAYEEMLMIRGIKDNPCSACSGFGVQAYGDTSTWHHGIGGQAVTNDICDKCWGSGDNKKPWVNLKNIHQAETDKADLLTEYNFLYENCSLYPDLADRAEKVIAKHTKGKRDE